jgi:hypothetical protein
METCSHCRGIRVHDPVETPFTIAWNTHSATTVAVALSVAAAVALELLRYRYGQALGFALSVFIPVAYLGVFSFLLGRYIRRARPSAFLASASILVGLFVLLGAGLPLMIYIGCRFGECINL